MQASAPPREHAFRSAADPEIDVDPGGLGVGRMDDAGDIAVGDETHRGTRFAHGGDEVAAWRRGRSRMSAVMSEALTPFALARARMVFFRGRVEIDDALGIAGADRDLSM